MWAWALGRDGSAGPGALREALLAEAGPVAEELSQITYRAHVVREVAVIHANYFNGRDIWTGGWLVGPVPEEKYFPDFFLDAGHGEVRIWRRPGPNYLSPWGWGGRRR